VNVPKALWAVLLSATVGLTYATSSVAQQLDDIGVKTAFVYNFVQFVDWPLSKLQPTQPLKICSFGDRPIASRLASLSGRLVKGHRIEVETVFDQIATNSCHVLFVSAVDTDRLPDITVRGQGSNVLYIAEESGLGSGEAVIILAISGNRVVFDINRDQAASQRLTISSKLLGLARRVSGGDSVTSDAGARGRVN
jgi:hypothetical protein